MQPGDVIAERFTVERFAAAGGMGDVFRAIDHHTDGHGVGVRRAPQRVHPAWIDELSAKFPPEGVAIFRARVPEVRRLLELAAELGA